MSRLLKSLRKSAMKKLLKYSKDHVKKATECVMALRSAFTKIKEGNFKVAKEKMKAIDELENQADQIRRSLLLELPRMEMENKIREALAHLIKNIDRIANTANGASRIFSQIPDKYFEIFMGDDKVMQMLEMTEHAAKLLLEMLDDMVANGKKIDGLNEEIQKKEHEIDLSLASVYGDFLVLDEPIPPFVAIQVSKGINYIEAISDAIEDVADYIKLLTIES